MHKKIKVIHVITGLHDGGAEAVLYRLVTASSDSNIEHHVISMMGPGKYGPLLQEAGLAVSFLNMPQGKISWAGIKKLYAILKTNKEAVVQTWMYHGNLVGGIVAYLAGVSKIFWGIHHTYLDPYRSKKMTIWIAKLSAYLSYVIPTKVICCAQKSLEAHKELGYKIDKLCVVSNGYDLSRFDINHSAGAEKRNEFLISPEKLLLGMVSRFDPLKDHANLLRALKILKSDGIDFKCALIGNGLDFSNEEISSMIEDLNIGDRVILLGQRSDVPALMNALDIHVLSSSSEAFPNVLAEAMACGTPCVSTDVGDASHIIGNTGWIAQPSNSSALAKAIKLALEARKNAYEWSERALLARKRIVENFSLELMVSNYIKYWKS